MRDINRIRPFLDKVAEVWERYPDLRFGQFVIDVVPDSDRLWNCEEDGFLEYLEAFDSGIRENRNSDKAKEKTVVLTTDMNTFDDTPRKIRCKENRHDFIGDGNYITEEELEIGKEYTLVPHGGRHDGMFVHIKEHPCRSGYPYYLFEELIPYDEEIGKKAALDELMRSLEEAEKSIREGRTYSAEEVFQEMKKVIHGKDKSLDPERIDGFAEVLSTTWKRHPHMRLGQIIQYALGETDLWDVKDSEIIEALSRLD